MLPEGLGIAVSCDRDIAGSGFSDIPSLPRTHLDGTCAMLSSLASGGIYDLCGNIITTDRPEWGTKSAPSGASVVDKTFTTGPVFTILPVMAATQTPMSTM